MSDRCLEAAALQAAAALVDVVDDQRLEKLARALGHPLRLRILACATQRRLVSASALARAYELDVTLVAYHLRCLQQAGILEVAHRDVVRGATRTTYRLAAHLEHAE